MQRADVSHLVPREPIGGDGIQALAAFFVRRRDAADVGPQRPGIAGGAAPNANKDAFVSSFAPVAQSVAQKTGLSPQYVLAQAGLETGWGTSPAAAK